MSSERVNVSLPPELFAALEKARGDVPRSVFVKRALESALDSGGVAGRSPVVRSHPGGDEQAPSANASREVPSASTRAPGFKCPVARCEFRALSPAAKCGDHGRTVVPA